MLVATVTPKLAALVVLSLVPLGAVGCRAVAGYASTDPVLKDGPPAERQWLDGASDPLDLRADGSGHDGPGDARSLEGLPDARSADVRPPDTGPMDAPRDAPLLADLRVPDGQPPPSCSADTECPSLGPCQPGRCLNGICSTESLPVSNKTVSAVAGDHGTLTQTGLTLAFDDMGVEAGCRDLGPVTAESRGVLRFVNPAVALPKGSVISGVTLELCHLLNTTNAVTLYETTLPTPPTSDFDPPRGNAIPGFPSYLGNTVAEESTAIPLSVLKGANIDLLLVLDTVVGCGMIATRRRYTAAPFGPKPGQCTSTAPQLTVHYCLVP